MLAIVCGGLLIIQSQLRKSYLYRSIQLALVGIFIHRALHAKSSLLEEIIAFLKGLPEDYIPHSFRILTADLFGLLLINFVVSFLCYLVDQVRKESLLKLGKNFAYDLFKNLPSVKSKLTAELTKLEKDLDQDLKGKGRRGQVYAKLPLKGVTSSEILSFLRNQSELESKSWRGGQVSGAVYLGNDAHTKLLNEAFGLYSIANPLHPETWPSVMKLESVIEFSLSLSPPPPRLSHVYCRRLLR